MTDLRDLLYPENEGWQGGDNAVTRARASQQRPLPKRFYTDVTLGEEGGGFLILLDGRKARTPAKNLLALPTRAAAEIVAGEWAGQGAHIDPADMHATRIANIGIDRIEAVRAEVIDEIARYACTDMVCYRADAPDGLVARESLHWDPVLAHADQRYGARFVLAQGIGAVTQAPEAIAAVRAAAEAIVSPIALASLHTMMTIAGSALIALSVADGFLDADAGFVAACVEEDWCAYLWGADEEAELRRARRLAEFSAAAALFRAV